MKKTDPRVDLYINKSADFGKSILGHLRELIHKTCPEAEEKIKWSFPHFDYKGSTLCSMASFKAHCTFGFRKASLMKDSEKLFEDGKTAMGQLGRIKSIKDLPSDKILTAGIKEAMKLNENGVKVSRPKSAIKKEIETPDYFYNALNKNKKALTSFNNFSPSHRNKYIGWITEARTEDTRQKRMDTAIEWMSEGKSKNWKYASK